MAMKIVHFADLHLDAQFAWAAAHGDATRKRRQALRDTLSRIVSLTQEVSADALLCGGDIYEHERFTPDTAEFLRATFAELDPTPVYIAPGNHDWYGPESLYRRVAWSPNVHIFRTDSLEPVALADGVTLWGAAHLVPANTRGFLDDFHVEGEGLALFHGSEDSWFTEQGEGKAPHAPFSPNPPTVWVARAVERETVVLGGAGAVGGAGRVRRLLSGRGQEETAVGRRSQACWRRGSGASARPSGVRSGAGSPAAGRAVKLTGPARRR